MHAEMMEHLDRSVAASEELLQECKDGVKASEEHSEGAVEMLTESVKYANLHRDIISRFGRYPYRNSVMGRESTPEEVEFLKDGPRFGQ